jgi:hypothetical protein
VRVTSGGGGGGLNMQIEIADEAGNKFFPIYQTLAKELTFNKLVTDSQISVKWGWLGSRCDGNDVLYNLTEHTLFLKKISCNYTHGLMKYTLEATDITCLAFQAAGDRHYGTTDQPIPLKQAIRQLCAKYGTEVTFLRPNSSVEWDFERGVQRFATPIIGAALGASNADYPVGVWRENSSNFIQTIMNWIGSYKTDKGKGVTPTFNSKGRKLGSKEKLLLVESPLPSDKESFKVCDNSIGTYIVNGGKDSPVLNFQPTFDWYFAGIGESGGIAGTSSNDFLNEKGDKSVNFGAKQDVKRGQPTYNLVTEDAIRNIGTGGAVAGVMAAQVQHARANAAFMPIKAELKLQGDPDLADPLGLIGKFISLIVISPYHLRSDIPKAKNGKGQTIDNAQCGDWLHEEPCHPILSNRAWQIFGSYHEIKEGSYVTTLQIRLFAPGSDIGIDKPLGNDPNGVRN